MTIDEAIDGLKRIFSNYELNLPCTDSLDIELEIIVLLEELKDYRDKNKMVVRIDVENVDSIKDKIDELSKYTENQYNKAIDDFVKEICKMIVQSENNGNYRFCAVEIKQAIADLAEQLKAGGENGKKKYIELS